MGRMSAKETRDYLIDELQRYVPSMDQVRSSEVADNRMGAAMGWMMIAKLAQWNHRWDDALKALGELEKIYGDLQQYPLEDIMFRNKNTPESIFEVQRTYTPGGLSVTTNVAAITTPYHNGKGIYDGVEIPEMGTGMTTWTSMRPNSYFCDGLQTKKSNDKRKTLNMAWNTTASPLGRGNRFVARPEILVSPGMQNTADFSNQKVFRYADANPDDGGVLRRDGGLRRGRPLPEHGPGTRRNHQPTSSRTKMRFWRRSRRSADANCWVNSSASSTWYAGESGIR